MTAYTISRRIQGDAIIANPVVSKTVTLNFGVLTNAAADTFNCIKLPAKSLILDAGCYVITQDTIGGGGTISLGDSGSATKYINAQAPSADDTNLTRAGTNFELYDTADDLILTIGTDEIDSKVTVWCVYADLSALNLGTV